MTTIEELLLDARSQHHADQPDVNILTEEDALQEAQLLSLRHDALRSAAALLFELRMALQLEAGNTGVLLAYGVRELRWTASARSTMRTAWNVLGSSIKRHEDALQLDLAMWPQAELSLRAASTAFIVGNVPSLGSVPPDYGMDNEETIRAGIADWHADFEPVQAVSMSVDQADP
jgi:hypothetical protein